jgi:hypothetical protein
MEKKGRSHLLGLEYEEDGLETRTVSLKRVREGLENCLLEIATTHAILKTHIGNALELVAEYEADEDFVVPDDDDDDVVIVNDDDSNSDWISDADAEKMVQLGNMLEHARNNCFTDLLQTESREFRQWWQRCFQDRLDIVDRGFGRDDGKRAQLVTRAIRDHILSDRTVTLAKKSSKNSNDGKCAMCGMSRSLGYTLELNNNTVHAVGRSCAGVVQSLIDFWEYLSSVVINDLEDGRDAYGRLLGYMQATEKAHQDKGDFAKKKNK